MGIMNLLTTAMISCLVVLSILSLPLRHSVLMRSALCSTSSLLFSSMNLFFCCLVAEIRFSN